MGNVDALATRVIALIADPTMRVRMGEAGRAGAERDFATRPIREFENLLLSYARS